jgi:hypothetical protein
MLLAGRKLLAGFLDAARSRVWVFCRVYPTDEKRTLGLSREMSALSP